MTKQRKARAAAAALLVIGVIAIVAFWPRSDGPAEFSSHAGHGDSSPSTTAGTPPADASNPPVAGRSPLAEERLIPPDDAVSPGDQPQSTLVGAASEDTGQSTLPRDQNALGAPRPDVSVDEVIGETALGGCLAEYGATGQCLPAVPPSVASHVQSMIDAGVDPSTMFHQWQCAEVRLYFPNGLEVRVAAIDPQGLDVNHDAVACGPND